MRVLRAGSVSWERWTSQAHCISPSSCYERMERPKESHVEMSAWFCRAGVLDSRLNVEPENFRFGKQGEDQKLSWLRPTIAYASCSSLQALRCVIRLLTLFSHNVGCDAITMLRPSYVRAGHGADGRAWKIMTTLITRPHGPCKMRHAMCKTAK